jgi:catechol 2,3-dioxygenase-like lactoylglutathione lyase family enzyme
MSRAGIHHLGLSVGDLQRSDALFYRVVLGFLGYEAVEGPEHVAFWRDGRGGPTIHLVRSDDPAPPDNDHCAFAVDSRARVDALHEVLRANSIAVAAAPQEYPHFGKGHYAVFFRDPDGRLFEVLHRPGRHS